MWIKVTALFTISFFTLAWCEEQKDKIVGDVTVHTDDKRNLEGTDIEVSFNQDDEYKRRTGNWFYRKKYTLDENGYTAFEGSGYSASVRVNLEGYWEGYDSDMRKLQLDLLPLHVPQTMKLHVPLRKQINPRPLFIKRNESILMPNLKTTYGYDLEKGDLVRPYGKGIRTDFIFQVIGKVSTETGEYDVTIKMKFPNEGDGILPVKKGFLGESRLLLGQEAPVEGYQPEYVMKLSLKGQGMNIQRVRSPSRVEMSDIEGYWFRIHSLKDPDSGEIIRARYGKLTYKEGAPIGFSFTPEQGVKKQNTGLVFSYYYSPDDSRSLESNGISLITNESIGTIWGIQR